MSAFPDWLLRMTWQASILTVIVLAVQWIFREKLSARWRYAFWLLVLARLTVPLPPSSPVSLFNYVRTEKIAPGLESKLFPPRLVSPGIHRSPGNVADTAADKHGVSGASGTPPPPAEIPSAGARSWFRRENIMASCALIWVSGMIILAIRLFWRTLAFRRRLGAPTGVTDSQTLALFASCKAELRVSAPILLCETGLVRSPALHGLGKPILLLPAGILSRFSASELRHVFLHELAHVKRRDLVVLWLLAFCKILHWFNPVLGLGFRRMAEERELACDELALSHAGEHESGKYGETILKLLESYTQPSAVPGLLGILEDQAQIRRRILAIAKFQPRARWSAAAMLLLLAVGMATLTDAQPEKPASVQKGLAAGQAVPAETMAELAGAGKALEQAGKIVQLLADNDPGNPDWQRALNDSFEKLDDLLPARGNCGGARIFMEHGIVILRAVINYLYAPAPNNATAKPGFNDPWDD